MAIDFNRTNNNAALNKPATQGLQHSSAQVKKTDSATVAQPEQTSKTQVSGESVQLSKMLANCKAFRRKSLIYPALTLKK